MSTLFRAPQASFPTDFPATDTYEVFPTDGLVGWYEFDDESGATVSDRSGLGNDATISGTAVWTSEGLTFDGTTNWVTTPIAGTAEFDWLVLLNSSSTGPVNQRIMGDINSVAGFQSGAVTYVLNTPDTFRVVAADSAGGATTSDVVGAAVADQWHLVSFTRYDLGAATRLRLTVNGGGFDDELLAASSGTAGNIIRLGDTFQQNAAQRFKGTMAAALLYNRGLSPDERIEAVRYLKVLAARRGITVA